MEGGGGPKPRCGSLCVASPVHIRSATLRASKAPSMRCSLQIILFDCRGPRTGSEDDDQMTAEDKWWSVSSLVNDQSADPYN